METTRSCDGVHFYVLPIFYLLSITVQRVLYDALLQVGLGNVVFVNMLTFLSMLSIGLILWSQIPKGWARNIGPWNWLLLLAVCEACGNALMIITLTHSNLTFQTIISRGCELAGVVLLAYFMSSSLENHISQKHMFIVFSVCFVASIVLPIIGSFFLGSLTYWVVFLVAVRSFIFAVAAVGEQVLVQNFAVHPYTVLITESIGGAVVTLLVMLPLSRYWLDDFLDQRSLAVTWDILTTRGDSAAVAISFFIMVALANAARVFVVKSSTALTSEVIALAQPSIIFLIMYIVYYISNHGFGEAFNGVEFAWMMASFVLIITASVLYFFWNKRKRQLFKLGIEAQEAAGITDEQKELLDFICISGKLLPRSMLGCYAGSETDYDTVFAFFEKVALLYHEIPNLPNDQDAKALDHSAVSIHDLPETLLPSTVEHVRWEQFSSVRFRTSRNISGYDFSPKISAQDRLQVLNLAREAILSFQLPTDISSKIEWQEVAMADCHSEWPHREYDCMEIAGILRDWPNNRAKFHSKIILPSNESFEIGIFVNEEDHLRFYCKAKTPSLNTLLCMYHTLRKLVYHVGKCVPYSFHTRFGYLQACPSNIGTGFKISLQGISGLTRASEIRLGVFVDDIISHALHDYIDKDDHDKIGHSSSSTDDEDEKPMNGIELNHIATDMTLSNEIVSV